MNQQRIQRYAISPLHGPVESYSGPYVRYADHVEAIDLAAQRIITLQHELEQARKGAKA